MEIAAPVEAAAPVLATALEVAAAQLMRSAGSRWVLPGVELGGNRCRCWRQLGDDGSRHRVQRLEAAGSRRVLGWLEAAGSKREVQWREAACSRQVVQLLGTAGGE